MTLTLQQHSGATKARRLAAWRHASSASSPESTSTEAVLCRIRQVCTIQSNTIVPPWARGELKVWKLYHIPLSLLQLRPAVSHPSLTAPAQTSCITSLSHCSSSDQLYHIPLSLLQLRPAVSHPTLTAPAQTSCITSHSYCSSSDQLYHIPLSLLQLRPAVSHPTLTAPQTRVHAKESPLLWGMQNLHLQGFSHWVMHGRSLGWRQKFYHDVQCKLLMPTSRNDRASPMWKSKCTQAL